MSDYKTVQQVVDDDSWHLPERLLYPSAFIDVMPSKTISHDEVFEKMCLTHFNPPEYYGYPEEQFLANYPLRDNEVGHDYSYRYILESEDKE